MQEVILEIDNEEYYNEIAKVLSEEYDCIGNEKDLIKLLLLCEKHRPYILVLDTAILHEELWHIISYIKSRKLAGVIIVLDSDYNMDFDAAKADDIDGVLQTPLNPKGIMPTLLMAISRKEKEVEQEKAYSSLEQELHDSRVNEFATNKIIEISMAEENTVDGYIDELSDMYGKTGDEIKDLIYNAFKK